VAIELKSQEEIQQLREVSRIVSEVQDVIGQVLVPGLTTSQLDDMAKQLILTRDSLSPFLGYRGYGATICVDVNDAVTNTLPSVQVLKEGDIVTIEVGCLKSGFMAKKHVTYPIGRISRNTQKLIETTKVALEEAIRNSSPGKHLGDIGNAIERTAEEAGFSVIREYTGHGIGRELHEEPQVLNFGQPGNGLEIIPGMTLCIIPMLTAGDWRTKIGPDKWGAVTVDGSLSAAFSHVIAIQESGPEILTTLSPEHEVSIVDMFRKWKTNSVLILGSYRGVEMERLRQISSSVAKRGYTPMLASDFPDVPEASNEEKVRYLADASRFVILENSTPGGQLFEAKMLVDNRIVTAFFRETGKIASYMLSDLYKDFNFVQEFTYEPHSLDAAMEQVIAWAEDKVIERREWFDKNYPWRGQGNSSSQTV